MAISNKNYCSELKKDVAYFLEDGGEYDADLFRGTSLSFKVLSNDRDLLKTITSKLK